MSYNDYNWPGPMYAGLYRAIIQGVCPYQLRVTSVYAWPDLSSAQGVIAMSARAKERSGHARLPYWFLL